MNFFKKKHKREIADSARRKKVPTILQMEAVECGAAALAMILAYHGKYIPLEEIRITCGVSRDGLKATNLMKGARFYGLKAKGYAKSLDNLLKMNMPCIIFWNFNHFVVLEGFSQNKVYFNDPAQGKYSIDYEEFMGGFTGVVIEFSPGPDFKKEQSTTGLYPALLSRIKGSKKAVVFLFLASLFLVIPGLIIPTFLQVFIDKYLVNQMTSWVRPLMLIMVILLLLNVMLTYVQQYYLLRLETKLALSTSSNFFWHILRLPMDFFSQRYSGEVSNRITLNDKVSKLLAGDLANAFLNVIVIIFYVLVMFTYDLVLTMIGILMASLNILSLQWVAKLRKDGNRKLINENGKLMGTTMSGISMIETLKASGRESEFFVNWSGSLTKVLLAEQKLSLITKKLNVIPPFLMSTNTALMLGVGAYRVMNGDLTIGMLVAFMYLMNNFMNPVNALVSVGSTLQETEGDMNRIDDVHKYKIAEEFANPVAASFEEKSPQKLVGHVDIKDLTFGYITTAAPLIKDFNLYLKPGGRVALVGGSGSGKSTLAKLIAGLYQPWAGNILFDGQARTAIDRNVLTSSLAMVNQEILLFEGSINQNISFWDTSIEDKDIIQAAKDADIHDMIASRKNTYDSPIIEKGGNLSGGQRQRMEIARALAPNPSILIMDESTSALDPKSEKIVMDNIKRRGCTCLIVAHRLSTIRDCDEIVVMDRGEIVQRGSHDQLIQETDGVYANLIKTT
ncbi:MAG: NHLP family bacteriocin export ABC transporter peptidase/permease/ATPase subunit [Bacteroidota bacterium]